MVHPGEPVGTIVSLVGSKMAAVPPPTRSTRPSGRTEAVWTQATTTRLSTAVAAIRAERMGVPSG